MDRRQFLKRSISTLLASAIPSVAPRFVGNVLAGGAKVPVKIGYLPITDHLLMIAAERETLRSASIVPVKFSSWPEIAEALRAGAIDAAFLLTPIGLTLRRKGAPIRVVLLGHRNGSVITVKNDDRIRRVEDLKGKTIAIPSPFSTHNILLRKVLAEKGIDSAKDLRILDMAPPEMVNALATGRIDGFIVAEPFGAQAQERKVGRILLLSRDIWKDHICCVLNVREPVIAAHPEAVQEIVSGMMRTAAFIEAEPAQAARGSVKLLGQKAQIVETVLTSPRDRLSFTNLVPVRADFEATQHLMIRFGIARDAVDLKGYLEDRFARGTA